MNDERPLPSTDGGFDRGLAWMVAVSALVHVGVIAFMILVPSVWLTPMPIGKSYTVELVDPSTIGGTNLIAGSSKGRVQGPPKVEAKAPPPPPPKEEPQPPPPPEEKEPEPPPPPPDVAKAQPEPQKPEPKPADEKAIALGGPTQTATLPPAPKTNTPKPTSVPTSPPTAPPKPTASPKPTAPPKPPATPTAALAAKPSATKALAAKSTATKAVAAAKPTASPVKAQAPAATPKAAAQPPQAAQPTVKAAAAQTPDTGTSATEAANADRERRIAEAIKRVEEQTGRTGGGAGGSGSPGEGGGPLSIGPGEGAGGEVRPIEHIAYLNQMTNRIKDKWAWAGSSKQLKAVVSFSVLDTGEIVNIRTVQPSGDPSYDVSVERAVRAASPLPPPPVDFRKELTQVEYTFEPEDLRP